MRYEIEQNWMYKQVVSTASEEQLSTDVSTYPQQSLEQWAAKLPQAETIYPNYWGLRGWVCVKAPSALVS
jgi:hypothetical protein